MTSVSVVVLVAVPVKMNMPPPRESNEAAVPCETLFRIAESLRMASDDANKLPFETPPPRLAAVLPEIVVPEIVIAPPLVWRMNAPPPCPAAVLPLMVEFVMLTFCASP